MDISSQGTTLKMPVFIGSQTSLLEEQPLTP